MRKWRPSFKAVYVIPEVHGNFQSLEVILNRILPLRFHKNQEDKVIFLGDYIDGDEFGADVIDALVNIKKEYDDKVIFLRGNHEEYFMKALFGSEYDFTTWINCGGNSTINSYAKKYNKPLSSMTKSGIHSVIPKEHIDFLRSLENFFIMDEYCFFHGSFDPAKTIAENSVNNFIYDYSASKHTKECVAKKMIPEFKDNYIFIGSHNFNGKIPFIHPKYMMLGGSAPSKLMVFELNSMSACASTRGKSRMYKYNFNIFE